MLPLCEASTHVMIHYFEVLTYPWKAGINSILVGQSKSAVRAPLPDGFNHMSRHTTAPMCGPSLTRSVGLGFKILTAERRL